jgi:hypothetical protein
MNPVNLILLICYSLSLFVSVIISSRLWMLKKHTVYKILITCTIAISWWLICRLLEFLSSTLKSKILWMNIGYLGVTTFFVTWLLLFLYLTEKRQWITAGNIFKLSILPALILVMIWTNHIHHLVWPIIWIDTRSIPWLDFTTKGLGFWVYAISCCGYLMAGILTLLNFTIKVSASNRIIYIKMLLAAIFPWLVYLIFLFNTGEFTKIDPSPIAFMIAVAVFYSLLLDKVFFTRLTLIKISSKNN